MLTKEQEEMFTLAQASIDRGLGFLRGMYLGRGESRGYPSSAEIWDFSTEGPLPPGACGCFIGAVALARGVDPGVFHEEILEEELGEVIYKASDYGFDWPSALREVRSAMEHYNGRKG